MQKIYLQLFGFEINLLIYDEKFDHIIILQDRQ